MTTAPYQTDALDLARAHRLAQRLRSPLMPAVGLLEVFLRRWEDQLLPEQVGLLRVVEREGRKALAALEAELAHATVSLVDRLGAPPEPHPGTRLEDAVPVAVAGLLQARDDEQLLGTLVALVRACGGDVELTDRPPQEALRTLPDELRAPEGRQLTLGPVLRALCAAARERAAGDLAPPRASTASPRRAEHEAGPRTDMLVALDLGDVGQVRSQLGDPGARWLVTKLQRTLRSLLQAEDRALRYPAGRFLILLRRTGAAPARAFAERLGWEWSSYLGRPGDVTFDQVAVRNGDVVAALRRLA